MKYPNARLLILSKAPVPGKVKTRLIPLLGAEAAAELYAGLLESCIGLCVAARLCPVELWCSPTSMHPFFQQYSERYCMALHTQSRGDLGMRISAAIRMTLQQAEQVVLIGADCPALTTADIEAAFSALEQGTDIVLGPAEDGGYYLIGMNRHHQVLFENMPWSTSEVLLATETRIQEQGLTLHKLPVHRDLDTAADYAAYQAVS